APSGPRERTVQRIELAAGDLDLKPYLQGWVPTSERSTFWVTANPYGDSLEHLKHLVHYPYGCIEQTTSSTRPLLYVSSFVGALDPSLLAGGKIEDAVAYGITRILSMQTPTGGFGYWPGSTDPQAWSTAYATHLLWDAQKMGYAVPADRLKDALGYLETWVSGSERGDREGYGDAEPYAHYVLALAGKGRKAQALSSLERIKNSRGKDQENAYLLKAALYLSGDRRFEKELKTPDVSPVSDERENSWSFYSDRRRRGLTLSIFQDLFGNDPAGEALAQRVADSLRGHTSGWYTTQELVWGITGLGKRVQGAAASFQAPKLVADGREIAAKAGAPGGKSDRQWALARAGERGTLQLKVADKGSGSLFLVLGSEGVRENGVFALGGNGLKLSRRFRTLAGDPVRVEDGSVQLADLVVVELTLTNTSVDRVQNIALVDRIPAGWEIENPRLGRGAPVGWAEADKLWNVDAMNVRDDRIELFGALERGETKTVVYAVRAVTSGRFTLPPAEAEAMYDPRVWAREAGGQVKVEGPWKDFLL
ncbi:MAG TPA: hypothetical protein VEY30_02280, partial [Myxococcaceae bacterium]|nr:hypothetical protein [Myxococcaceae bacterium]